MTQPASPKQDASTAAPPPGLFRGRTAKLFWRWWSRHMRDLDRDATQEQVHADGGLSYSYAFLVATSCGIATLGLMLNSAAVIIGAMLVAPLMGPIVLLGFAIAETDVEKVKRSALALIVGVIAALAISVAIVKLSPFIPPTPEILARINPNLFDLLVAVLSGMVAGYAVTHRKIGTVAGVAIATALMPPLAASGYGLATGALNIFQGAFFLFLTNMVAIALTVAGMATWYGFGNLRTPKHLFWQTVLAGVALVVLSIPLVKTLNESVSKTLTVNQVEAVLRDELDLEGASLDKLSVRPTDNGPLKVSAVIFTPAFDKTAHDRLVPALREALGQPVELALDQVVLGDARQLSRDSQSVIANPVGVAGPTPLSDAQLLGRHLRELMPVPILLSEVDGNARTAKIQVSPHFVGTLGALRQMEAALGQRFTDWRIDLIPPMTALPDIHFNPKATTLTPAGQQALADITWALTRWQVQQVQVNGTAAYNETGRKTARLALDRATYVAEQLQAAGFQAHPATAYPAPDQRTLEREQGAAAWRMAWVEPTQPDTSQDDAAPGASPNTAQAHQERAP